MTRREFWTPILTDPAVERLSLCGMGTVDDFLAWMDSANVTEYRYRNGGLVFVNKGDFDEVHVAFRPSEWGRSVALAFRDCFARKMRDGRPVVAGEQEGEWRTKPPISHGWAVLNEFEGSVLPRRVRRWILTLDAWQDSPVGRKTA